jgi:hypothetical protein
MTRTADEMKAYADKVVQPDGSTRYYLPTDRPHHGMRLTDCCAAVSTFSDVFGTGPTLCCKHCWNEVWDGQGDGTEHKDAS